MSAEKPKSYGYRQITTILVGEIRSGRWTLDAPFPTEMELVERFQVGRNTVREALRELQDLGYIKRRRGARSVLTNTSPETAFVNSVRSAEELLDYAKQTKATVLTTEKVIIDEKLARRLEVPAGEEWVRLLLIRTMEGQSAPFTYSEVYVLPRFAEVVEDFGAQSELYPMIERRYGLSIIRIEQEIEATLVDANVASRLSVPMGSPSLSVRSKFYSSEGELVEIGLVSFPASRYKMRLSLDRRAAPSV